MNDPIIFWYKMGIIYKITYKLDLKGYIGQTARTLQERWDEHKSSALHYAKHLADPEKYSWKGTSTYLYRAMVAHGIENFTIETVADDLADDELDFYEINLIEEYNTLAPHGYNLTTGGGHFHHCELTKQVIREKVRNTMVNNIDQFRTSEKTKGMPPYCSYKIDGNYEAYYVNNHPLCESNVVFSKYEHGTIDKAKEECVKFVNDLNASGKKYIAPGPTGLGKCIRKVANGYQVRKTVKGKPVEQSFTGGTDDENKQAAIAFREQLITQNK